MTIRNLPAASVATRHGLRSDLNHLALDKWNPDVRAAADDKETTISILEPIGADWFGEGVTSKRISAALRAIGKKDVTVVINSPGGDFFEGLSIYNLLRDHSAKVTVKILGVAASAASVIAMAGDEVLIAKAGFFMIHNTWVIASGDRHAFREVADWLEPFDATAVEIYAARTGMDEKAVAKLLDKETWVTGKDAVDQGFADDFLPADQVDFTANNSIEGKPVVAAHKIDNLLARSGVSRSERRELLNALKGGMRDAASTGMSGAAVFAEVESLLSSIRSI
jgi:ATP-dependent protease ClpP protease subunit